MPKPRRGDVTSKPHDAIIKHTFSQREHAAGLLKAALAPEIVALVRWSTLELQKIHFVDRSLRGRYADLLFSAEMNGGDERLYIHVLIEHQSKVESLMIFRMGAYMWRHWEHLVGDDPNRQHLPAIIPILIHHSATGWTAATTFEDLIAAPEAARAALRPYIPSFRMKLVDVSRGSASGLAQRALTDLGRVVLWCLSVAGDRRRLETEIDQLVAELNTLYTAPNELDALLAVLRYLVATQPDLSVTRIAKLLEKTAKKGLKEVAVDVLDELREEGKREGGARILLGQLAARFGAVPARAKARVLAADERTLSRWSLRVLTATTLADVLDDGSTSPPMKKPAAAAGRPAARKRARAAR